jgi:16S rRNA (uracil1498-N3)-methyltransferase
MNRFYIEHIEGETAVIGGSEARHIVNVLRKKAGDVVLLFDGLEQEYEAEITGISLSEASGPSVLLKILSSTQKDVETGIMITLFQSLPRFKKFDFIVEKATELGVVKIVPVISERVQIPHGVLKESGEVKIRRWQKIALSAAKQCGRTVVPEISGLTGFAAALDSLAGKAVSLIPWECEPEHTLKSVLKSSDFSEVRSINVFIGPEGGYSAAEISEAKGHGVIPVSLGKRILRAETAPIVTLGNILYELEK